MRVIVVTPPAFEPVSLAEARRQLRLNELTDDTHINELIKVARGHVEDISAVALASRVVEVRFRAGEFSLLAVNIPEQWRDEPVILPLGPVTAATSVKYLDENSSEQTADPSTYRIETGQALSRLVWITRPTMLASNDSVRVTYTVGYPDAASIPRAMFQAVLLILSDLYSVRVPQQATLNTAQALCAPWVLS